MGTVRVPLCVQKGRLGGLPAFLQNSFVSASKFQLLYALKVLNMVPAEKLAQATAAATQGPPQAASKAAAPPPVAAGASASLLRSPREGQAERQTQPTALETD